MGLKKVLGVFGLMLFAAPSMAEVGVSITVGEPGFFGHIEIGDAPRPVLVAPTAVIIERPPPEVAVLPLYLFVPAVEVKDWRRYCRRYDACGRPVYFVQERWYRDVYVPHYRKHRVKYERLYRESGRKGSEQKKHCPPGQAKKGNCD